MVKRTLILGLLAAMLLVPSSASAAVNAVIATSHADLGAISRAGFGAVSTNPYREDLDRARAHGLKAIVWLQGYVNEPTCQFAKDDAWLTAKIRAIRRHPAVLAYQVDDEPHVAECPQAPTQIAARTARIHALDPHHPVLVSHYREEEFRSLRGAADILAVVSYPCSWLRGCVYSKITAKVAAARRAGWTRLWGMPQAAGDEYYRMPTPREERRILATWKAAGVRDRYTYSWDETSPVTLHAHRELWRAFR